MKNSSGFLRLVLACVICLAVIFGSVFVLKDSVAADSNFSLVGGSQSVITSFEEIPLLASNKDDENESQEKNQGGELAVKSSGVVKGNIIEKFISPYTAKNSYNNVYLKNNTELSVDIKSLLSSPLGFKIKKSEEPQVLIIHTHTTETFMTEDRDTYTENDVSRTNDEAKNMISIGKIFADTLNAAGIKTVHDTTVHDFPKYSGSYTRAAKTITSNLKKYPSIKIVLDIHRDAISSGDTDKVKLTTKIDGKKAAQVMLVMGSQSGGVENFPGYKENLKLAVRFQQTMEAMYPTLARSLSLTSKNYNESLTSGSMLLEIGTDANTLGEVRYSAELAANALKCLLNTLG